MTRTKKLGFNPFMTNIWIMDYMTQLVQLQDLDFMTYLIRFQ